LDAISTLPGSQRQRPDVSERWNEVHIEDRNVKSELHTTL
jgi:hypothetical protein